MFSNRIIQQAWSNSNGRCQCELWKHNHSGRCFKHLTWEGRNQEGPKGWVPVSVSDLFIDDASDCEVICLACYQAMVSPSSL